MKIISEDEVDPQDKIGDVGYRIVHTEEMKMRVLEKKV